MKKHILFLAVTLLPLVLLSQSATITQMELVPGIGRTHRVNIYPDGNDGIILQHIQQGLLMRNVFYDGYYNNNTLYLTHLNSNSKISGQNSYKFKDSDFNFRKTFLFGNKVIAIYDRYEGKADTYHLAYVKVNGSRTESNKPIPIYSFPLEKRKHKNIIILVSEDKKYFALANQVEEKKDDAIVNCAVFDEDFNMVWKKDGLKLPSKYAINGIDNMLLGNDKNLYIIHESYNKEKNMITQFESAIVILNEDGMQREIVNFSEFVPALSKLHQKDNKIYMLGYYLLPKKNGMRGVYNTVFDPASMSFTDLNRVDFTDNLINQYNFRETSKDVKSRSINNLNIRNIINLKDGGIMIFAEESFVQIITTTSSKGGSSTKYYYYDYSIMYSRINKDGTVAWNKIIPKFQLTKNSYASINSFAVHNADDYIYIIYNDNVKNLHNAIAKDTKKFGGKGNITCIRIDPESGDRKASHLLQKGQPKALFYRELHSLSKEEAAFIGKRGGKTYICKVNFN